jgi:hypothetical protein
MFFTLHTFPTTIGMFKVMAVSGVNYSSTIEADKVALEL